MAIDGANSGSTAGPAMPSVRSPTSPIRVRARAGSREQIAVIRKSSKPAARSAAYPRRWAGTIRPAPISPTRTGGMMLPHAPVFLEGAAPGSLARGEPTGAAVYSPAVTTSPAPDSAPEATAAPAPAPAEVLARLRAAYGTPEPRRSDGPLAELIQMILSQH